MMERIKIKDPAKRLNCVTTMLCLYLFIGIISLVDVFVFGREIVFSNFITPILFLGLAFVIYNLRVQVKSEIEENESA